MSRNLDYMASPPASQSGMPVTALFRPRSPEEHRTVVILLSISALIITVVFSDSPNWLRNSQDGYLLDRITPGRLLLIVPVYTLWITGLLAGLLCTWNGMRLKSRMLRALVLLFCACWLSLVVWHSKCPHGHFIGVGPMTFGTEGQRNCNQHKRYLPIWWPISDDQRR